jgi:endonuclease-3 related protein
LTQEAPRIGLRAAKPAFTLYQRLLDHYGPQGWWPLLTRAGSRGFDGRGYHPGDYTPPRGAAGRMEVVIGAVLTQNTSWRNVEAALGRLEARGLIDRAAILACEQEQLAEVIRPSGYFNQKARKLRLVLQALDSGPVPPQRRDLLKVWGVGPETADSILLYAYQVPTFVVDAYTRRLLTRLGWIDGDEPYGTLQGLITRQLPEEPPVYGECHALVVRHAKEHCRVRARCAGCPLLRAPCAGVLPRSGTSCT